MKKLSGSTYVEATLGMSHGDPDLRPTKLIPLVKWLLSNYASSAAGVRKLSARIIPEEDESNVLNLLDAHMGSTTVLNLPDDNPSQSYQMRKEHIRKVFNQKMPEIRAMYGP